MIETWSTNQTDLIPYSITNKIDLQVADPCLQQPIRLGIQVKRVVSLTCQVSQTYKTPELSEEETFRF